MIGPQKQACSTHVLRRLRSKNRTLEKNKIINFIALLILACQKSFNLYMKLQTTCSFNREILCVILQIGKSLHRIHNRQRLLRAFNPKLTSGLRDV